MRACLRQSVVVLAVVGLVLPAAARGSGQAPPAPPAPAAPAAQPAARKATPEEVARWVKELADDDFMVREKAMQQLWQAGPAAEAALKQAVKDGDAEVVRRATTVLERFKYGLYPDTPAKIAELIERYRAADPSARQEVIKDLLSQGKAGYTTLVRLINLEENAQTRQQLQQMILAEVPRLAGALIAEGEAGLIEELLEGGLASNLPAAFENYVAYWLAKGKVDDKINAWVGREALGAVPEAQAARVLAALYRAKGDLAKAKARAEQAGEARLVFGLMIEGREWAELAKRGLAADGLTGAEALGFQATFDRLSGNAAGFKQRVEELTKYPQNEAVGSPAWWPCAKALLLNGRPDEAEELLKRGKAVVQGFELLCARGKYADAFKLLEDSGGTGLARLPVALARARVLHRLGEADGAKKALAEAVAAVPEGNQPFAVAVLIETEVRLGLKDQAFERLAAYVSQSPGDSNLLVAFAAAFPKQGPAAWAVWKHLRGRKPDEDTAAAMKRLRGIMAGQVGAEELAALAREALAAPANGPGAGPGKPGANVLNPPAVGPGLVQVRAPGIDERLAVLVTLAAACRKAGQNDLAKSLLEKAAQGSESALPHLELGDLAAAAGQWPEAVKHYEAAWSKQPSNPLALYLRGYSLVQAGNAEGKKYTEAAHVLPLADHSTRLAFAEALKSRGETEAARREYEVIARTADRESYAHGNALIQLARLASARGEHDRAADLEEQMLLRVLRPTTSSVEAEAYLSVPQLVRAERARALLAAGKEPEAVREAEVAVQLRPQAADLVYPLVLELEKRGRKAEADGLYRQARAAYDAMLKEYPRSAFGLNNLAWLSACCRRNLPEAQQQAEKAVALAPGVAAYLDTLAEVKFQRGDKEGALELTRKCRELEPDNEFYKRQLVRYQAGDPATPIPEH